MEVFGEGETLGIAAEEALEKSDFVGLGPYSVEFEWRRFGGGGGDFVVSWGFEFGEEEIRVRGRGVRVMVVGGFAFDGEFARRGFDGERRERLRGRWC